MNLQERVLSILALKYVDEVIIAAPWMITDHMITNLRIDVVVDSTKKNNQTIPMQDQYEICR